MEASEANTSNKPSTVNKSPKTILSGSAPSGNLTIGNYIGAIKNWAEMQSQYNCFYLVVDLHSLTVKQDPEILRARSLSFFAQYLACGLDPKKNTVFMQSHVSEHTELAWILNCYTSMGDLSRMTQFKDKSQKHPKNINAGLFTYPVLMAADILLYQADLIPVGEDQKQHLELTRDLAQHFNNSYGDTFVVPDPYIGKVGARIMALQDPMRKMDKSDPSPANFIAILNSAKDIEKKFKTAVTDSGSDICFDVEKKPGVSNLLSIYAVLSGKKIQELEEQFQGKMYGHLKMETAQLVIETLKPVQEKYSQLMKEQSYLFDVMSEGAAKAKAVASKTLRDVYEKVGLILAK